MILAKPRHGRKPTLRHALIAAALLPLFALLHFAAYWLRFEGRMTPGAWSAFEVTAAWAVTIKLVVFGSFGVYGDWKRFVTFHDLVELVRAAVVSSLLLLLVDYLFDPGANAPRSVFLMDFGFTVLVVGGLRASLRFVQEHAALGKRFADKTPALIVGTNNSGESLLREIRRNPNLPYRVVGFVSEAPERLQSHIGGVPVIGVLEQTCGLAKRLNVSEVLITAGDLPGQQVRQLVAEGQRAGVVVKVLPSYEQLLQGRIDLRPRRVSIEDLLRREPVTLDTAELHRWLQGRVLLVTGSSGSIGSEICRQLLQFSPRRIIAVDRSENGQFYLERGLAEMAGGTEIEICLADINDGLRINHVFQRYQPEIVFHAAAYKHVPLMEMHPGEAVKNIALATRLVADIADRSGVESFVMVSTDKAVNPTSVMGCCKRVAELYVQTLARKSRCRFVTVRFGNVLDSAGSVVPIFREQIASGGPVTVTDPAMTRYFMTIPEASQLVVQAGAMGRGGEIFVLDMGAPVRIVDLARDMIELSGLAVGEDIEIRFVGMRPGEKRFEELHCRGEEHTATRHPKIMVARSEIHNPMQLQQTMRQLESVAERSPEEILPVLRQIVPEFRRGDSAAPAVPVRAAA